MRYCLVAFLATFCVLSSAHAQNLLIENVNIVDPLTRKVYKGTVRVVDGRVDTVYATPITPTTPITNDTVVKSAPPPKVQPNKSARALGMKMPQARSSRAYHDTVGIGWRDSTWKTNVKYRDVPVTEPLVYVNAEGKWLIPGLYDMHVHSYGNAAPGNVVDIMGTQNSAKAMLAVGVTGFLDLFSPEEAIFAVRAKQREKGIEMADLYAAGPILTCTGGHGTEYGLPTRVINSPSDARREIASLATKNPDVIKIVYDHAYGSLPTIDIATMEAAVKGAAARGIKTVIHIGTWQDAREAIMAGANCITHVHGEPIPADLVVLMKQRNVFEIPTLTVQSELVNITREPRLINSPLLATVTTAEVLQAYRDTAKYDARTRAFRAYVAGTLETVKKNIRAMHEGGVRIMTGTDAGNIGVFQGYSVHRELELLVAAGLSTWDALAAATSTPAEFLEAKTGLRKGDVANFVLLDASPIDDIRNTQSIHSVVYHGKPVNREALLHPPIVKWSSAMLDDFISNGPKSTSGFEWKSDLDTAWGGRSTQGVVFENGVVHVSGTATPVGQRPALAGISLPLTDDAPIDVTAYKGVRIKVTSSSGPVQLKLVTKGISNYDYHAVTIPTIDVPRTIEYPFSAFRQQWSAPVPWTGTDVNSVALWVSTMGVPAQFDFVIDSIELY